jgi:hypothetical protein
MRYNLESTLPINAFSPRGGRGPFSYGMTLEGGGGGVIESVVGAVSDVGQSVANVVSDVGTSIDNAVIQPAIDDPVGTTVKIGAIVAAPATGGASLYAIPAYTVAKATAAGIPLEDVAVMAAIQTAAAYAGVSVADYVGTVAEFGTAIGSEQTAMLAAQNVGIGTGSAASTAAGQIAGGAASGAVGSGLSGGDIGQGLLGGAINAGIGAGVGAAVDTGAGLFNNTATGSTNTGTTNMDEIFGPTYSELGYSPSVGPSYSELGYDPYANLNIGDAEAQQGGFYGGPGYGYQPENPYTNMSDAELTAALASQTGGGLTTATNLLKQYGPQVVKALLGGAGTAAQRGALGLGQSQGGLLGAGANYLLSGQAGRAIQSSAAQSAQQQRDAAALAQQQASFTPVGMTTAFGQSNFGFDPTTGKLTSAGYTPTSQVAGQVQNLFGLGASALPTTTNTQDVQQQYIAQQQGLLAPGREQQLAQLRNRQYQRGTTGLATGGTMAGYAPNAQGLMATNPEMAAFYNAQAQENARLASNAPTYAQNLLNSQIATGTNLFGAANTLEGYAQQPLSLSTALGTAGATAGSRAAQLGLLGNLQATQTQQAGNIAAASGQIGGTSGLLTAANPLLANLGNAINTSIWG